MLNYAKLSFGPTLIGLVLGSSRKLFAMKVHELCFVAFGLTM